MSDNKESGSSMRLAKDLIAGTVAGWAQVLSGQPFDTVKVRLQTQTEAIYNGPVDCAKKIIAKEGFSGFYKGTLLPMLGVGVCVSVQFAGLSFAKGFLISKNKKEAERNGTPVRPLSLGQIFLAGAFAGVVSSPFTAPIEHIRIRLQTQTGKTGSPFALINQIYREHGLSKIFKGSGGTALREVPGFAFYFLFYEIALKMFTPTGQTVNDLPAWKLLLSGAAGGYGMWIACYPADVIKTQLQTDNLDKTKQKYTGILDCAKHIARKEGIRGFYKGFAPCILRALPVNAATFATYELVMRAMGGREY